MGGEPGENRIERESPGIGRQARPGGRATQTGIGRAGDPLWAATAGGRNEGGAAVVGQDGSSSIDWSSSGRPPVLRLLMTFPGGVSPRSHSSQ